MATSTRWQAAQEYERGFWQHIADRIAEGTEAQLDWYRWRSDQLVARLRSVGLGLLAAGESATLEIGCGPIGVSCYFPARRRMAVDPLDAYYRTNPVLTALRSEAVDYRAAQGEAIPAADAAFDLVIMENCIDHVQDVDAVMREIVRVLKPDGVLYLTVNCRTRLGYLVHRVLSRTRIDAGHPYTFTAARAGGLVRGAAWKVLYRKDESYWRALGDDLRGPGLRPRLKALLGTSEFVVTVIAQRRSDECRVLSVE